jgi:hypothetical protein
MMPIKHSKIKIVQSASDPNVIEVTIPHEDIESLLDQAKDKKTGQIQPEFLIQVLARHLIAIRGAKTKGGSVDNW